MTCPACGTPTVPGARFCFACGTPLAGAQPELESERRVVTVLFGDLSDFTSWSEDLDPERVGVVTDRVLETLTAAVVEFGGHVDKLTGDGLMAVFGAPVAHEDDAERAVRAAARMQFAVRRVVEEEGGGGRRLGLRVGVNTGEVLAGVQAHVSYTVIGDAVNTASRLSDAAGIGSVYAGRETALATMSTASWRALPPLRLKGKREPVTAYELVGLRPPGASRLGLGDEAPFVGRDAELGLLIGRLLDVVDRRSPRAALLTGEAGVGKTRLGQELARFAGELPGARVLWGRCAPYGEGRDLAAVAEMVRTACGISESDDVDTARARVARTVARLGQPGFAGSAPGGMAERLQALLGLEEPDAPAP
ncbi:MAG: adenylate/guanylate cyclase, partial [Frankiales bacterium]|nr:adenylate/guanylate cyclase [Frankiales bacterium]